MQDVRMVKLLMEIKKCEYGAHIIQYDDFSTHWNENCRFPLVLFWVLLTKDCTQFYVSKQVDSLSPNVCCHWYGPSWAALPPKAIVSLSFPFEVMVFTWSDLKLDLKWWRPYILCLEFSAQFGQSPGSVHPQSVMKLVWTSTLDCVVDREWGWEGVVGGWNVL